MAITLEKKKALLKMLDTLNKKKKTLPKGKKKGTPKSVRVKEKLKAKGARGVTVEQKPKAKKALAKGGMAKKKGYAKGSMKKKGYAAGGVLKKTTSSQKGLKKLPTSVRNKMGFMSKGGMASKKGKK